MIFAVAEKGEKKMTRFEYYTANADRLMQLLENYYVDAIDYCSPDMPRDSEGDCAKPYRENCDRCFMKWLSGEMEGTK